MGRVQFAGADVVPNNQTWVLGQNNWTQLITANSPPAVFAHAMAYDAGRECLVMFGGLNDQFLAVNETWELFNGDWTNVTPMDSPEARFSHTLTYDQVTGCMVLIGGGNALNVYADPWTLLSTMPATFEPFGTGCPGAFGVPTIAVAPGGLPWVGDDLVVNLGNLPPGSPPAFVTIGLSNTTWAGFFLPADLGPLGAPGCTVFASVEVAIPIPTSGGTGQLSLPIPDDPSLAGLQIFNQGVVLEPGVNPGGIIVTGAAALTLGRRY